MIPVIDRIKRDYPELSIRILISQPTGANQKAAMLHLLAGESRYPVIVTNDIDMRATPAISARSFNRSKMRTSVW